MDLTDGTMENRWKNISESLNFLLRKWGSDLKCCGDKVRLLRVPCCINRKEKYGPEGRQVKLLKEDYTVHSIEEIDQVVDYALHGGDAALHQSVLEELTPWEEQEASDSDLFDYLGEWEDNIFTDSEPYVVPEIFKEESRHLFQVPETLENVGKKDRKMERLGENEEKEQGEEQPEREEWEAKGEYYSSYQGISLDYGRLPEYEFFQVKDILFFLSNRKSSVGIRHSTIFFCGFSWYHFMKIRDEETFIRKCKYLNTFFKPMLSEKELVYQARANFSYIKNNGWRGKYIRSDTIEKYYKPTEEEKWLTSTNFFEENTPEWIEKKRRKHAKQNLEQYHRKRARQGYVSMDKAKRRNDCYQYLLEHPETTYKEAKEILGISTTIYYKLINEARKEACYEDPKRNYETCLKENPDLTFQEYHSLCGGSYPTYARYKKKIK